MAIDFAAWRRRVSRNLDTVEDRICLDEASIGAQGKKRESWGCVHPGEHERGMRGSNRPWAGRTLAWVGGVGRTAWR